MPLVGNDIVHAVDDQHGVIALASAAKRGWTGMEGPNGQGLSRHWSCAAGFGFKAISR
jgi:hypothetical protein